MFFFGRDLKLGRCSFRQTVAVAAILVLCVSLGTVCADYRDVHQKYDSPRGGQILLTTYFARGHTAPAMALALELASRGYSVTFGVPYRKGIADHFLDAELWEHPNVTFLPLPMSEILADMARKESRIFAEQSTANAITYLFRLTLGASLDAVNPLREHLRRNPPDLFISDTGWFASIMVAPEFPEVPFVRLAATIAWDPIASALFPFVGLDFPFPMNAWQWLVSNAVKSFFLSPLMLKLGPFGEFSKGAKALGLPPLRSLKSLDYGPVISQSMMGLEPPHAIGPGYTFCGPITRRKALEDLPADLRQWLDEKESVVYVTMATTNAGTAKFWEAVVRGLGSLQDASILLAVRGLNKDRLPASLPGNILQADWVPQTTVLMHPSLKAMVNGGGLNSINEGIAAGLPQVAIPFHTDQFMNTAGLLHAGAGLRLNRDKLTADDVARAVSRVAGEASFRVQAGRLRLIQESLGGVMKAADTAELFLKLGVQGMKLLEDATKELPWYQRTTGQQMPTLVAITCFFALILLWCIGAISCCDCCKRKGTSKEKPPKSKEL